MKSYLKRLLPVSTLKLLELLNCYLLDMYSAKSYSQEGEDMILRRLFADKATGMFVDVGAHHPMRFSNTYYFYKRGWRGINIDPNPDAINLFKKFRKGDINIHCGISNQKDELAYIMFDDSALNTFDRKLANERVATTPYKIIGECEVKVRQLSDVLEQYLSSGQDIDFLSIDAEGYDLSVLKSNNWEKFRPEWILVEELGVSGLEEIREGKVMQFLTLQGYHIFAKTLNTIFFRKA